ncbi:MAG: GerMN domain-containing protein [Firmicutes bacterium]|nr:GerMN domain-containing protein [Bacillota bacterium]
MRFLKIVALLLILAALLWGTLQMMHLKTEIASLEEQLQRSKPEEQRRYSGPEKALIYLIRETPASFELVPVSRTTAGPLNPFTSLQALINGPLAYENFVESVPHTTEILSLEIEEKTAKANFSQEIVTDFVGGSSNEANLVQAIVNTLTEFPEIEQVQILVEGQEIESIGGHILILGPLTRDN